MSPHRPAALLLLPLLALLCACPGREDVPPPYEGPALPELVLPEAHLDRAYTASLGASGGTAPLRYTLEGLPPGLTYESGSGVVRGSATQGGSYEVHAAVLDARGARDERTYALRVVAPLEVSTRSLASAKVGVAYSVRLQVAAAVAPVEWTLVSGTLPAGMTLASDGLLSGTPSSVGTVGFAVQARDAAGDVGQRALLLDVRSAGTGTGAELRVANWNVEWFGDTENGPSDEALQQQNVRDVMLAVDADVWALQEVVSTTAFAALEAQLPGYDGLVSSDDARVPDGSYRYREYEQKVALLYRTDRVQVLGAQLILTSEDYAFAGRPPLRVDLRLSNGTLLTVITLHLKAQIGSAQEDYDRRKASAVALKSYLDATLPTQRVLVLGDWNDDLDTSILAGNPTPFRDLLDDAADYTYLTAPFSEYPNQGTTVSYSNAIDHQLATNELQADYVAGSVTIVRPAITDYGRNTSDHYPVTSRFDFPAP
jgi:endonuclease/exonuclease/phosphatase family metal-dependent hydrolase